MQTPLSVMDNIQTWYFDTNFLWFPEFVFHCSCIATTITGVTTPWPVHIPVLIFPCIFLLRSHESKCTFKIDSKLCFPLYVITKYYISYISGQNIGIIPLKLQKCCEISHQITLGVKNLETMVQWNFTKANKDII